MDRLSPSTAPADIEALVPAYEQLLARFLLTDGDSERREVLSETSGFRRALAASPSSVAPLFELHARAQLSLSARWQVNAGAGANEQRALSDMARGRALPLLQALMDKATAADAGTSAVTSGQLSEASWRKHHAKLVAAFDQADDLFLVLDANGATASANTAFTRATGWSAMQALTLTEAMWKGPLPRREPEAFQLQQRRSDGSCFKVEWLVSPVIGPDGRLNSYVCVGRDIAQQQRVADELRANDKLRAVAALSAGIAHDFNNLLGAINGLAELCELEAPAGSRQARNLGRIRQAGAKAAVLVRRMLDFARQTPKTVEAVSAFTLVEDTAGLLRASLPARVSLSVELEADAELQVDVSQIQQVFLNLANNAAHAMREHGGHLRIVVDRADPAAWPSLSAGQNLARIRVIDSGEGMTPEVIARIFDPFFTTKPVGEGTGLGLSAAHGIVGSHGGWIDVDSAPGKGSVFSVFLPC